MARFSSVQEFSPTGTVISTGTTFSNSIKTEAAKDARAFLNVATVPGGGQILETIIQGSPDNVNFADIKAFNDVVAVSNIVEPIKQEELATYTRLKYIVAGLGSFTLGASLEKKQGV